ncbi:MAG TPA: glutamine--tRNA ligase/YqeY domain fusion protein [Desulfosalsimonadaceae bacterium]|nr:glutamine--tRNA ligase/YqeY domain fusion protein [Desulfosalsimonadaceae bacterium]
MSSDSNDISKAGASAPSNFIRQIIEADTKSGKYGGQVVTRFPPEPNGYLHIGHAKSICLNFGFAEEFGGTCHLRFDDTNPLRENVTYVDSIKEDVRWLGFDWKGHLYFASDYFDKLYEYALTLIKSGKAYVDSLSPDEIRAHRGTLTAPGKESPYRHRSVEESLDLFQRMAAGEFEEGECVLRAKIDMSSPNVIMRDPTLYRIRKRPHHRTGEKWHIYPMYDFAHCLSDSIEGITHSICTLEFENNRELYDWILDALEAYHPQQIEFARLNLSYTVLSKRKLIELVDGGYVDGWDDPRMPTISGFRRRGYTPAAIRNFCERIGVAKRDSMVDLALLEHCIREDLNKRAPRFMGVLRPLKVVIENYPEGETETLEAINNPEDASMGTRQIPFSRELFIEKEDFMEVPPKKFFRLAPGREVRLRYAYFITCTDVIKDENGEIVELRCTYDPETRGGDAPDGRKVKSTLHWVSAPHAADAEIRLYTHLFTVENPAAEEDFKKVLNPESLEILSDVKLEPALTESELGAQCQFERLGYFCQDVKYSTLEHLVFNRIVTLRDQWAKVKKQQQGNQKT